MPNEPASEQVRNFAAFHHSAVLSTLDATGAPFGSVVNYVLSPAGHFVIAISRLAEHTRNLLRDPRASLFIAEFFSHDDPQSGARASVLGRFEQARLDNSIADNSIALEQLRTHYLRRFPEAFLPGDFQFFRMVPERVRWIGGFGQIGWVQGEDFLAASEDPLAAEALTFVRRFTAEHPEGLLRLYEQQAPPGGATTGAVRLIKVSSKTFTLERLLSTGVWGERVLLRFERCVTTLDEVSHAITSRF